MGLWGWLGSFGASAIAVLIAWPVLPEKGAMRIALVAILAGAFILGNLLLKFHTGEDFFEHTASAFGPLSCQYIQSKKCVPQVQATSQAPAPGATSSTKGSRLEASEPQANTAVAAPPMPRELPQAAPRPPAPVHQQVLAAESPDYSNLDGVILSLTIPETAKYSFYDWLELIKKTPGVRWQDPLKMLNGPCAFQKKGRTKLALDGRPDISDRGTSLAEWNVSACGLRSMVTAVSFERTIVDQNRTDDIAKGFLQSVRNTGATVQKMGCNLDFGRTEQMDYYSVKLAGKRKAVLSTKMFCSAGGCDYSATVHLADNEQDALKFDGRKTLTKAGC
jgi:hypothetical protein